MKKLFRRALVIILLHVAVPHNILGMQLAQSVAQYSISGLCSLAETALYSMPLVNEVIFHPHDIRAKKLENVQSDTPPIVTNFITKLAEERGIQNAKAVLNGNAHTYSTDDNGKIIKIPQKYSNELELLLHSTNHSASEKKSLDQHTIWIQHELYHILKRSMKYVPMYEAAIGTVGALATSTLVTSLVENIYPPIHSNFILHNTLKLTRSGLGFAIAFKLMSMNLYKKYDEIQADDGIPNKKELLEAPAEMHKAEHNTYLKCIDIIKERADYQNILYGTLPDNQFSRKQLCAMKIVPKTWFNNPIVMDIIFHSHADHPSNLRRQLRFEKRIADIENNTQ